MNKKNSSISDNEAIKGIQDIVNKLKIFEEERFKSFVGWKFSDDEKCSVSEVKFKN